MSNVTMVSSTSPLKRITHAVRAIEAGEYASSLLVEFMDDSNEQKKGPIPPNDSIQNPVSKTP